MAGKAVKRIGGYYVWEGGLPSKVDMETAPLWTVFPGTFGVTDLVEGPTPDESDYPAKTEGEDAAWFPSDVSESYYWTPKESAEWKALEALIGIPIDLVYEIQSDNVISHEFDDVAGAAAAVKAGWSLVKAPTPEGGKPPVSPDSYRLFVIDEFYQHGNRYGWSPVSHHFEPKLPVPDSNDVKVVNRHRRGLGMKPLDMADGWTVSEVEEMAKSIRTRGRLPNPKRGRFHDEMVRQNPQLGNQYEYMDEIQGYAVDLAPRVGGQRSIRDIYNVVIEAQDEWSPLVVKWSPNFGGDRSLAAEQIGQHLMAGVQLALEIETLFDEMKASTRGRAQRNPDGFPLHVDNALVVRVRPSARDKLLPDYLYYMLMHAHAEGWFRQRATGTAQQCIRAADVTDIPVEGHGKLGRLVKVTSGAQPEKLKKGDVILQRVGNCGKPFFVTGTDPLTVRNPGGKTPPSRRSDLKRKLMR